MHRSNELIKMFSTEICILLTLNFLGVKVMWDAIKDLLLAFNFYLNKEREDGTVIGFKTKQDEDERDQHAAIIQYTADGKDYVVESENYQLAKPEVGMKEIVYYDKEDPFNAMINVPQRIAVRLLLIVFVLAVVIGIDVCCILEMG